VALHSESLTRGQRLLDALVEICETTPATRSLHSRWQDMLQSGEGFRAAVSLHGDLTDDSLLMLQAMPFRGEGNHELHLVALYAGLRAGEVGPDEVVRCRAVLNTAVDSIITIDSQGRITSLNPATVRMFGYPSEELIGRNVSMLMPDPWSSEHDTYIRRYLETGHAKIIGIGRQISGRRRDGSTFLMHLAISEFSVGGSRYFTGIVRDLSDLDHVQKQLLQSERLAAIGQMVTGLAHESRNALQRAQACLDMLALDLQDQPEQLDLARRARTALQDLHRLYEEVRSYAAPIHLEFRACDLNLVWRKEWENLSGLRRDRRIRLIENCVMNAARCEIDIHRMEQVFRNVFENAIHACGNEGCITVTCDQTILEGHPAVMLRIADDGPGMKPEVCARMFEPFFTTKQKGTGLGMAIAQRILSAHSGTISASSAPSGGAEIQLVIPVRAVNRRTARPGT
jgi:PAS domain S-box-containing protein